MIVTGNRISTIGKTGKVRVPKNSQVIDATEKFLIPGLLGMHVHAWKLKQAKIQRIIDETRRIIEESKEIILLMNKVSARDKEYLAEQRKLLDKLPANLQKF